MAAAEASCDYDKDIVENADGTFTYSAECHMEFGKTLDERDALLEELAALNETIEFKDEAIARLEERNQLWMETSDKLQDRVNAMETVTTWNKTGHFLLGVGATVLSVWAAGQLAK